MFYSKKHKLPNENSKSRNFVSLRKNIFFYNKISLIQINIFLRILYEQHNQQIKKKHKMSVKRKFGSIKKTVAKLINRLLWLPKMLKAFFTTVMHDEFNNAILYIERWLWMRYTMQRPLRTYDIFSMQNKTKISSQV